MQSWPVTRIDPLRPRIEICVILDGGGSRPGRTPNVGNEQFEESITHIYTAKILQKPWHLGKFLSFLSCVVLKFIYLYN
jgi:hypothetical protein